MDMKRDYYEDIELFSEGVEIFWFACLVAALVAFPFIARAFDKNFYIYTANYLALHVMVAVGLNLLVGYTGQISLGHAGFFAIGGYGTLTLMLELNLPFVLALPLAGLTAAAFGFLLGLPALRLEGPYLAIATLGFGLTVTQVIGRLHVFGGRQGLHAPELTIAGLQIQGDFGLYWIIVPLTLFMTLAGRNLVRTKVGRAFVALRDSDVAAETMGVNLTYYKTLAFAISAFYTGIAGGLFAFSLGFIEPNVFNIMVSILFLAMVVVGGLGSIFGSIAGGVLIAFLNLKLAAVQNLPWVGDFFLNLSERYFSVSGLPNIQFIVFGLIMVLIIIFEPLGIYGFWLRTKRYFKTWPF